MDNSSSERQVLLAAPRGFCAGVERAVGTVRDALQAWGAPVYVRRQIVHNPHVVAGLEKLGAIFVAEVDQVPEGAVLVLAAHGVAPGVREAARVRGLRVIDGTCPLVTKIHREARRFAASGYTVVLIGQDWHDEVVGTRGEAPGQTVVVSGPADIARLEVPDENAVAWVSQSTLAVEEVAHLVGLLRQRFPRLVDPPSDDICYAVSNRQAALKAIAGRSDLVLVVGARNSHNSRQLVPVALAAGASAARLIESADELMAGWLTGVRTVGVTSGASTPDILVRDVLTRLTEQGFPVAQEVTSAVETQVFAKPRGLLPPRLRLLAPPRRGSQPVAGLSGPASLLAVSAG
jgi:4-hydroxy-3-methylbut-2-enyl diphosphate reductase